MYRMIISMFFGMNVGLTAGILLGATLQGNLYISTILSISIGMFAGILCGSCFGILSILEGIMAGLMGGMMGAMLGEMVNLEQSINLIRIFLFLSFSTIFLFTFLPQTENQKIKSKLWFLKPALLATFITLLIVTEASFAEKHIYYLSNSNIVSEDHTTHKNSMTNNLEKDSQIITIQATNMKYSKTQIVIEKELPITLVLDNQDKVEHDIEIRIPILNSVNDSKHKHGTEENLIHLHAEPNSEEKVTFTPANSGVYEFICTVPGHKESGMVGTVIVN